MKHILALAAFLRVGTAVSYANSIPTCGGGVLSGAYTNTDGTSNGFQCEINDEIYSNFVYVTAGADPDAAQITVGIDNNVGLMETGFQFGSTILGLDWETSGFSFSYTITVDQAACAAVYGAGDTCSITSAQGHFDGAAGSNAATMIDQLTPGGTIQLDGVGPGDNTKQINPLSPAGITSTNIVLSGTNAGHIDPIIGIQFDTSGTATSPAGAPEPATLSLMGAALSGLGLLQRSRAARTQD